MLGVIRDDQNVSVLLDYFQSLPFDNAFIVDKDGTLVREIDQLGWRQFVVENSNSALTIADAIHILDAMPRMAFSEKRVTRLKRLVQTVDLKRRIVSVAVSDAPVPESLDAYGLVMAGGFGRRLGDLTKNTPKPMLEIAGKPIARHLVDNFLDNGIRDIFISTFYLRDVVERYFRDGSQLGARLRYLDETTPLGTAGCLSLIGDLDKPLVIVNGDVVTNLQMSRLLEFHTASGADITMATRRHSVAIPFGVVEHVDGSVRSIREKPRFVYDINVAIYVLSPHVLRHIPAGQKTDMPDLIQSLLPMGYKTQSFPMFENWIDVGSVADFTRASETYDPASRPSLEQGGFVPQYMPFEFDEAEARARYGELMSAVAS